MKRFDMPFDTGKVASAVLTALSWGVPAGVNAIAVTGAGTVLAEWTLSGFPVEAPPPRTP